jgi:NH3-dependent NAD+ synthetase
LGTAKDLTLKGASAAGNAVGSAAKKLKTPAIAAGAGLAGIAGGMAIARGSHKNKILGVSLPNGGTARSASKNLGGVAKNVGAFAERTGRVAEQVRVASEAISESNSRRSKSPVEVVLEGLTTRSRSRAG